MATCARRWWLPGRKLLEEKGVPGFTLRECARAEGIPCRAGASLRPRWTICWPSWPRGFAELSAAA